MTADGFSESMLGTVRFGMNRGVAATTGKPSFEAGRADIHPPVEEIAFSELPEKCVSPYFWPQYKKLHNIQ